MARFPTSSKLANDCWKSYSDWAPRSKASRGRAAETGTRLHEVIRRGFRETEDGSGSLDIELARKVAIELDVYDGFRGLDLGLINSIYSESKALDERYFEESMIVVRSETGRSMSDFSSYYEKFPPNAILGGSLDFGYVPFDEDGPVTIVDWKTGRVEVEEAERNQQMLSLAHMLGDRLSLPLVRIILAYVTLGKTSEAMVRTDLFGYLRSLQFEPEKASAQNCQYCIKKGGCDAYFEFSKDLVGM